MNQNGLTPIYYVYSDRSRWDVVQHEYTQGIKNVRCIEFRSAKHGIPFLKVALPKFINMSVEDMERLTRTVHHPLWFTIRMVGVWKALRGFINQAWNAYKKRH